MFYEILKVSLRDFFTPRFLFLSFAPLFFSGVLIAVLVIFGGVSIFGFLDDASMGEPDGKIMAWILQFAFIKWLASSLFILIGAYALPIFSTFLALIVISFMTPFVTQTINKRHYNFNLNHQLGFLPCMGLSIISVFKFLLLFIACLPLLLIPVLGWLAFNIPFFYLYYKLLLIDVGSSCLDRGEFMRLYKDKADMSFICSCLCFYLLCMIPFVALFLQLFFVIILSHMLFMHKKQSGFAD